MPDGNLADAFLRAHPNAVSIIIHDEPVFNRFFSYYSVKTPHTLEIGRLCSAKRGFRTTTKGWVW